MWRPRCRPVPGGGPCQPLALMLAGCVHFGALRVLPYRQVIVRATSTGSPSCSRKRAGNHIMTWEAASTLTTTTSEKLVF